MILKWILDRIDVSDLGYWFVASIGGYCHSSEGKDGGWSCYLQAEKSGQSRKNLFTMYKFRSMIVEHSGSSVIGKRRERITFWEPS